MKNILVALAVGLLATCSSISAAEVKPSSLKQDLANAAPAELPVKAAAMVKAAKAADRSVVTIDVVKTSLAIKPGIAPTLVAAIAKATPDMAGVAAETAAREQPKMASEIAKAAAIAAPTRVESIVAGVCRAVPADYKKIAKVVAQVLPNSGKEILKGVVAALPELKASIETALANYGPNTPTVASVLDSASSSSSSANVRGPGIKPPYVTPSGTPGAVNPSGTYPVPPGGRDYAKP